MLQFSVPLPKPVSICRPWQQHLNPLISPLGENNIRQSIHQSAGKMNDHLCTQSCAIRVCFALCQQEGPQPDALLPAQMTLVPQHSHTKLLHNSSRDPIWYLMAAMSSFILQYSVFVFCICHTAVACIAATLAIVSDFPKALVQKDLHGRSPETFIYSLTHLHSTTGFVSFFPYTCDACKSVLKFAWKC